MKATRVDATVFFEGTLDEACDLSEPFIVVKEQYKNTSQRVRLDVNGINCGNSVGILSWIKAIDALDIPICYVRVPHWMVEQFNVVRDFLRGDVHVESIEAPFYSPTTAKTISKVLTIGVDIPFEADISKLPFRVTDESGGEWEPDFVPEMYLDFIQDLASQRTQRTQRSQSSHC